MGISPGLGPDLRVVHCPGGDLLVHRERGPIDQHDRGTASPSIAALPAGCPHPYPVKAWPSGNSVLVHGDQVMVFSGEDGDSVGFLIASGCHEIEILDHEIAVVRCTSGDRFVDRRGHEVQPAY